VTKIVAGLLGLVVGGWLLITGILGLGVEVTCGKQVMVPGQVCVVGSAAKSYAERKSDLQRPAWYRLGGGGLLVLAGGVVIGFTLRNRRRAAAVSPPAES
jgi:hypothetical protein